MSDRPRLSPHARVVRDRARGGHVLLAPESIVRLTGPAPEVLSLCDGVRTTPAVVAELERRYSDADVASDVAELLGGLARRGLLTGHPPGEPSRRAAPPPTIPASILPPEVLIAELTHRCPLSCGYCSNPLTLTPRADELDGAAWRAVVEQAVSLGVLQVHLSGGEPLARPELTAIVGAARGAYTNLVTSAWGLDEARLRELADAGLDHVQISFQSDDAAHGDAIAGARAHEHKRRAARAVVDVGLALSINVVLHRATIDRVPALVALAEELGATRIELANVQLHGWALDARDALLPSAEQVAEAAAAADRARARLAGRLDVLFVHPDYFRPHPKRCMDGWGRRYVIVAPDGRALPCPGAHALPLPFDDVRERPLSEIWRGEAFERYRGTAFLPEPCASCERREIDLGGCRCQAFALGGDAGRTDPACSLAPDHAATIERARAAAAPKPLRLRGRPR